MVATLEPLSLKRTGLNLRAVEPLKESSRGGGRGGGERRGSRTRALTLFPAAPDESNNSQNAGHRCEPVPGGKLKQKKPRRRCNRALAGAAPP